MNVCQALTAEKRFLSPRRGPNLQPSDDQWDALTIELPRLQWWAQVQCKISPRSYVYCIYWLDIILNILWLLVGQHKYGTCILAHHLRVGSSMVRTSHRSSEGCEFDPRLALRNCFSEVRAWWTFIYHLRYLQARTSRTYVDIPLVQSVFVPLVKQGNKEVLLHVWKYCVT